MSSIFSPKMPALPPPPPPPEPPVSELSAEEKERIKKEQDAIRRKRKGRKCGAETKRNTLSLHKYCWSTF